MSKSHLGEGALGNGALMCSWHPCLLSPLALLCFLGLLASSTCGLSLTQKFLKSLCLKLQVFRAVCALRSSVSLGT